jgi:hypothetical protein
MRKNQCAVVISHIRTSRRNVKTLPEATHDLAQRELAMLPLRAARIEAGNLPSGGHAIVVIRNDSHVQGARASIPRASLPMRWSRSASLR